MVTFTEQVYALTMKVSAGRVTTYKALAEALGCKAYQAVGSALNKNPDGFVNPVSSNPVPCHRVVQADGTIGGFAHGTAAKIELLEKEGIVVKDNKIVDFERFLHIF